jgi:hypothetical protein
MAPRQAQPAQLAAHRRGGAVDPGVSAEPHHVAPTGLGAEPAEQLGTGEAQGYPQQRHGFDVGPGN